MWSGTVRAGKLSGINRKAPKRKLTDVCAAKVKNNAPFILSFISLKEYGNLLITLVYSLRKVRNIYAVGKG